MTDYDFRLTEETSRWAVEVLIRTESPAKENWWIAFSNPTAGPWKRLMAPQNGGWAEVYRYARDEERPDLVLVSDTLGVVLIAEAKGKIQSLLGSRQMNKSLAVIDEMENQLSGLGKANPWGKRADYLYLPSFIWGNSSDPSLESSQIVRACKSSLQAQDKDLRRPVVSFAVAKTNGALSVTALVSGEAAIVSTISDSLTTGAQKL